MNRLIILTDSDQPLAPSDELLVPEWVRDEVRKLDSLTHFAKRVQLTDAEPALRVGKTIRIRLPGRFAKSGG